mmetsp:Transcript_70723/g.133538  ORF Transcript_70723/g.133538 Transcript_70723/m.133538 type:complete len:519 (-) Transcript_70723:110-1666(-)
MAIVYQPPPRRDLERFSSKYGDKVEPIPANMTPGNGAGNLSARARKQIYMHSTIFDAGGPNGSSVYASTRQKDIHDGVKPRLRHSPREPPEISRPSAADVRITVNTGHKGVIHPNEPSGGAPMNDSATMSFSGGSILGGPDEMTILRARRDRDGFPRELWATNSQLDWKDVRSEMVSGARKQEFHETRKGMDANMRKRQELSSEILESKRNMTKSTSSPSRDIWADSMKYVHAVDSSLCVAAKEEARQNQVEGVDANGIARERLGRNLAMSNANMFPEYQRTPRSGSNVSTPQGRRRRGAKDADSSCEDRRRTERNYSDLFGNQTARGKTPVRGEMIGSANCSFLDPTIEIAHRNVNKWPENLGPRSPRETLASQVLPLSENIEPERTAEEKQIQQEERICWDTRGLMDTKSEIARHVRESSRNRRGTAGAASPREDSASATDRKRLGLTSGQFRRSSGGEPAPWDDGRAGPGPMAQSPSLTSRSCPTSPLTNSYRGLYESSLSRQRKLVSLMSNVVF